MKNNPNLAGFIIALVIVAICYLIYGLFLEKKDSYLITNPSETQIEIQLDGKTLIIAPKQTTNIELAKGKHRLNFELNGQQTDTTFMLTRANAIINPTKSDYFVFTRPYGPNRNVDSLFNTHTLTIDEKVYHGNIKKFNDLFIQDFYYNLDQDYPTFFLKRGEEVDLKKIFSKDDFIQFYFENYE